MLRPPYQIVFMLTEIVEHVFIQRVELVPEITFRACRIKFTTLFISWWYRCIDISHIILSIEFTQLGLHPHSMVYEQARLGDMDFGTFTAD